VVAFAHKELQVIIAKIRAIVQVVPMDNHAKMEELQPERQINVLVNVNKVLLVTIARLKISLTHKSLHAT